MKVLWLEISQPSRYEDDGHVALGWQDALEDVVRGAEGLDLHIAFESTVHTQVRTVEGVTYHPIKTHYSWWEKKRKQWHYDVYTEKVVKGALSVIEEVKPDLIHVFGNEWPFGLVAEKTDIPVVIHIQGSIVPYNNALYPPGYNVFTTMQYISLNPINYWRLWKAHKYEVGHLEMEKRTWKCVNHYMGRTIWDRALVNTLSPGSTYHHVEEALRLVFLKSETRWNPKKDGKIRLFTTGFSSYWKGPDMLLKTAHILKGNGVNFEWNVAGYIGKTIKTVVEGKEGTTFEDNNVNILGFTKPEKIIEMLGESTLYIHTAYIENSPNAICEAQYLGLPIISTHVGGIETLLDDGKDGILIPSNDPWMMADAIIRLSKDNAKMKEFGNNGYLHARKRHNPDNIKHELLSCYNDLIVK